MGIEELNQEMETENSAYLELQNIDFIILSGA